MYFLLSGVSISQYKIVIMNNSQVEGRGVLHHSQMYSTCSWCPLSPPNAFNLNDWVSIITFKVGPFYLNDRSRCLYPIFKCRSITYDFSLCLYHILII